MTRTEKIAIGFAMLAAASVASLSAQAQDYKIGYITDLSGPLAGSYTPTWQGFDLYIKALNDRGGVNGRKVAVTIDDDSLRADRAVAAAKKQVESNEVLGIFGLSLSSTQAPVVVEMQKVGVPNMEKRNDENNRDAKQIELGRDLRGSHSSGAESGEEVRHYDRGPRVHFFRRGNDVQAEGHVALRYEGRLRDVCREDGITRRRDR